jgi:hypothetical protein
MLRRPLSVIFGALWLSGTHGAFADDLCAPLRRFVESVKPGETRVLKFHTSWGSNFRDSPEPALSAKRCEHSGYDPAKEACAYLMEHSATEFPGNTAKAAIACLSSKTRFASQSQLHAIALSVTYGTDERGDNVDISLTEDNELGGMVLSITVTGY